MQLKNIVGISLFAFSLTCIAGENKKESDLINQFSQQLEFDLASDDINGSVSALILKKNKILWADAKGLLTSESKDKVDENTIYRIGSLTKTFTSVLMMMLQEDGVIDIDESVEKYLPEVKSIDGYSEKTKFTFRHLASHTSGLIREPRDRKIHSGTNNQWQSIVLSAMPKTSFRYSVGERFSYSNIGFAILGLALSRASDTDFITLVKRKIFEPLEMKNSFFNVPGNKMSFLAQGMAGGPLAELDMELPKQEHDGRGYKVPNGAIYSTPQDMAKFLMALMGTKKLLSLESRQELHSSQTPTTRMRRNYGLGLQLFSSPEFSTAGHSGSTPGYSAYFEYDLKNHYGVIIMRNYNWGNTNFDLRLNALLKSLSSNI